MNVNVPIGHRIPYPAARPSLKSNQGPRSYISYTWASASNASTPGLTPSISTPGSSYPTTPYQVPQPPTPHVHFPPSPGIAQTYVAYSRKEYDRSAAVVPPNECALPARGCPGRTHMPCDARPGRTITRCGTPGPSRSGSRSRMTPPPSPPYYIPTLFRDDYPFPSPSPAPSPRIPTLSPDNVSSPTDGETSEGLSTPPDQPQLDTAKVANQLSGLNFLFPEFANSMGSEPYINAPGHPPISKSMNNDVFVIANALNGINLGGAQYDIPAKKKKPTSPTTKRVRTVSMSRKKTDDGCLGGF